jgi:hypothetical protein
MGGGRAVGRPGAQKNAERDATSHINIYGHNVTIIDG